MPAQRALSKQRPKDLRLKARPTPMARSFPNLGKFLICFFQALEKTRLSVSKARKTGLNSLFFTGAVMGRRPHMFVAEGGVACTGVKVSACACN